MRGRASTIVLSIGALSAGLGLAAGLVQGADTKKATLVADSYVRANDPRENFGTSPMLRVDGRPITSAYLRFDVDVPADEQITEATLRIYATADSDSGVTAHPVVDNGWDENTIDYYNAPPLGEAVASSGSYERGDYVSLDVTELVGDGPVSIGLRRPSEASNFYNSRESESDEPELVVETAPIPDETPPDTVVESQPASPTKDDRPAFGFVSTEPGSFECRVDEEDFAPCVSPHTLATLSDGAHIFEVRAIDGAGNVDPSPAAHSFVVDTAAPALPTGLTAAGASGQVTLEWDDSPAADLSEYVVLRSTTPGGPYTYLAGVTDSAYTDAEVSDGTTYHYVIEANDTAGNRSALSEEASATAGDPPPPPAPEPPPPAPEPQPAPQSPAPAIPASGAYFGAYVGDSTGRSLEQTEALLGRRLAIVHDYRRWDHSPLLEPEHERWAAGGRLVFINWKAKTDAGDAVPWARIADGSEDARIDAAAAEARGFARPLFLAFHHEPEDEVGDWGEAAEFAAAFRRIVARFRAAGAHNVGFVWNVMGSSKYYELYGAGLYPGDDAVDWIAWDPYNWVDCNGRSGDWEEFAPKLERFYSWLLANGHADKPFMLGEYGSDEPLEGQPSKGDWFLGARDTLSGTAGEGPRFPNLKALVYFDSDRTDDSGCAWQIDSSSSALAGFRALGAARSTGALP
jgi:chitodextrinase